MGQSQTKKIQQSQPQSQNSLGQSSQPNDNINIQQVQEHIKNIFQSFHSNYQPNQNTSHQSAYRIPLSSSDSKYIYKGIQLILKDLNINLPIIKKSSPNQDGFSLNTRMLSIFYHKNFLFKMSQLLTLLVDKLENIMTRSTLMIKRHEYMNCLNLAYFIIVFSDTKLIRMVHTLNVRNDLSQETMMYLKQNLDQDFQDYQRLEDNLIDKYTLGEIERIQKCLRISLNLLIDMKMQIQARSPLTLNIISKLQNSCFILYMKALLSSQHSKTLMAKACTEFFRVNMKIGQYFLGKGSNECVSSIYQTSVVFLQSILSSHKSSSNSPDFTKKQLKSLPSHLFPRLPLVTRNTAYDFIMNTCLHALVYQKNTGIYLSRISFNRLMTFKLLDLIVKKVKVTSVQITYLLEEICLQTKVGQIQRSFVTDLVQNYINLLNEVKQYENSLKQMKQRSKQRKGDKKNKQKKLDSSNVSQISSSSPSPYIYCHQANLSQLLIKYLQSGKQSYNIKYSNKQHKISTIDVITQLQNDQNQISNQFVLICQKYLYEGVLNKKVQYNYNDRQIWNEILPGILSDKGDDEDLEGTELDNNDYQSNFDSKKGYFNHNNQHQESGIQKDNNSNKMMKKINPVSNQIQIKSKQPFLDHSHQQSYSQLENQKVPEHKLRVDQNLKINFHSIQDDENEAHNQKSQQVSVVNIEMEEEQAEQQVSDIQIQKDDEEEEERQNEQNEQKGQNDEVHQNNKEKIKYKKNHELQESNQQHQQVYYQQSEEVFIPEI